jgi:hypothetical protein
MSELQCCLPLDEEERGAMEVALWSSGLDSLAGLANRMVAKTADHYVLFGTGANSQICARQRALAALLMNRQAQQISCVQTLYRYTAINMPRNRNQRARGFVFLLLGAVCALLTNQQYLHIYENGVGAINLPFRASEVGLDHTRAVHPVSLFEMSELLTRIIGTPFRFVNPFMFQTKAEMCTVLHDARYTPFIAQTLSCDRMHREIPSQCGSCSSCLLRKQSLLAAGLPDGTDYVFPSSKTDKPYRSSTGNHLRAMLWQVRALQHLLSNNEPWGGLVHLYPRLIDIIDRTAAIEHLPMATMQDQIVQMYRGYVSEWEQVRPQIERGLLDEEELRAAA